MSQYLEMLRYLRPLAAHPLAVVAIAAQLAALLEQRAVRHRTADFSVAYKDIEGPPPKPPRAPKT